MKTKIILSPWSKEVKKAMIDKDLDVNDIANRFHWTKQYVYRIINGYTYHRDAVHLVSTYLNITVPEEYETLSKRKK